jgi:hypothetical protein
MSPTESVKSRRGVLQMLLILRKGFHRDVDSYSAFEEAEEPGPDSEGTCKSAASGACS